MAMSTCRECNAALSSSAKTCPNCGAANPNGHMAPGLKAMLWVSGIIALGIVAFVIAGIGAGAHLASKKEATVRAGLSSLGLAMTRYTVFEYRAARNTGMYYTCGSADWKDSAGRTGTMGFVIAQDEEGGTIVAHAVDSKNAALARRYEALYAAGCLTPDAPL